MALYRDHRTSSPADHTQGSAPVTPNDNTLAFLNAWGKFCGHSFHSAVKEDKRSRRTNQVDSRTKNTVCHKKKKGRTRELAKFGPDTHACRIFPLQPDLKPIIANYRGARKKTIVETTWRKNFKNLLLGAQ